MEKGTPVEKKLQLVAQVRSQYQQNQNDLFRREELLYGKSSASGKRRDFSSDYSEEYGGNGSEKEDFSLSRKSHKMLILRILASVVLFLALVYWQQRDLTVVGVSIDQMNEILSADYIKTALELLEGMTLP